MKRMMSLLALAAVFPSLTYAISQGQLQTTIICKNPMGQVMVSVRAAYLTPYLEASVASVPNVYKDLMRVSEGGKLDVYESDPRSDANHPVAPFKLTIDTSASVRTRNLPAVLSAPAYRLPLTCEYQRILM